jgi:hypothetical protein
VAAACPKPDQFVLGGGRNCVSFETGKKWLPYISGLSFILPIWLTIAVLPLISAVGLGSSYVSPASE